MSELPNPDRICGTQQRAFHMFKICLLMIGGAYSELLMFELQTEFPTKITVGTATAGITLINTEICDICSVNSLWKVISR